MGSLFDAVRSSVSAADAARAYGLFPQGWRLKAVCPWHADTNPSLSFKGGRCKCFVCNNGGSAIDLTAQTFGLSPLDAARKLAADFALGLGEDSPPMGADLRAKKTAREVRQQEEAQRLRLWRAGVRVREAADHFLQRFGDKDTPALWAVLEARELGNLTELNYI